jgi:WhiB family redox-sensing transcriptional regulator
MNREQDKQAWTHQAACKGQTHKMFPAHHKDTQYINAARRICDECPVRRDCLNYALEFPAADMHGVWAGLTPRQLAAEQRRRNLRPVRPTISQMWAEMAGRRPDRDPPSGFVDPFAG